MDQENDMVISSLNGGSQDSAYVTNKNQGVDHNHNNVEGENLEVRKYTTEMLIESSKLPEVGNCEDYGASLLKCEIVLPEKEIESEVSKATEDDKGSRASIKTLNKTKCTVPQPFALATKKRASNGTRPIGNDADAEDENSCVVTSLTTLPGRKPTKGIALAPTFRSTERAERRKEFYKRSEEKHLALEAERIQWKARTNLSRITSSLPLFLSKLYDECETALKHLRKNLVFKANPMPSFYHDGQPTKAELKKLLPTRAKSPKLGRRKCGTNAADSTNGRQTSHI